MSILCLVCVWHAIVMVIHTHYGKDTAEFADMIAIIILGGVFILFQVIYIGLVSGFVSCFNLRFHLTNKGNNRGLFLEMNPNMCNTRSFSRFQAPREIGRLADWQ